LSTSALKHAEFYRPCPVKTHNCLQTVADVCAALGYSNFMRHKKYVRLFPPVSDFSKLGQDGRSNKAKPWLKRVVLWGLPVALLVLIMASCGGGGGGGISSVTDTNANATNTSVPATSSPPSGVQAAGPLSVTEAASGLVNPWGMAFLPGGSVLVTEREGKLRIVSAQGAVSAAISGVPAVDYRGQGGLLDVVLDPAFATNQRIYFSYAKLGANDANSTAVARAVLNTSTLALFDVKVIFEQLPKVVSQGHFGSRLVFDKNGYLFVTLGDRQTNEQRGFAQDLARGNGKVMRITTDGAAAPGNPTFSAAGAQSTIWSYGHRNPQGAALNPTTGELWVNEHGAQGGDELNLALAGKNYGWPLASYSQEYGTTTPVGTTSLPGMVLPVSYWLTKDGSSFTGGSQSSIAPSGMAIYTGDKFPEFKDNLFIGALAGTALWRVVLGGADGKTEVFRERLLASRGERIRDVRVGPDGWIYLLNDNGKLLRVSK
jgi:aldose sugar dehydrogenase